MASRSFEFSVYYQKCLLHRIFSDSKFASQAIPYLREDVFDNEVLKYLCRKVVSGATTLRIITSELKKEKEKLDVDFFKSLVLEVKSFNKPFSEDETNYSFESLREFIDSQDIHSVLLEASVKADEGGRADDVRKIIGKAFYSLRNSCNVVVDPVASYAERFLQRKRTAEEGRLIYVSSGFKNIDDDIGGPMLGQIWVFFGDTNLGKSQAAVSAGKMNMMQGFPVLHFSTEDKVEITLQRYDASITGIPHDKLITGNLTKEEEDRVNRIYSLLGKKRDNYLRVVKADGSTSVRDLQSEYRRLQVTQGFYPKVVVLDSPHDMVSFERAENFRLSQRQLYHELRDFCQQENVALIMYDQSKQEVKGKIADTSAASESYDKARIVDGFITMNQTKMQKKDNIIQLFTAKMKDRDKFRAYYVRPNFKTSRFIILEKEDHDD